MKNVKQIIEDLGLENQLTLEDIPQIDLYMDQVIQLFENYFAQSKRNEEEKILTKTMINNYAKGKLFIPIKNKKYTKDHLMLINLIYQLKGALSINDIKMTLQGINEKILAGNFQLEQFYESYLHVVNKNVVNFKEDVENKQADVQEATKDLDEEHLEDVQKILFIASLANMSNFYRRAAEKLIDELHKSEEQKNEK